MGQGELGYRRIPGHAVSRSTHAPRRRKHEGPDEIHRQLDLGHRDPPWFSCYILDYHNLSLPQDQAYVRESRQTLFLQGRKLEDVQAGREERLPLVPPQLDLLRQLLKQTPWLGGQQPNYADFRVLACFLWVASVATTPPLHDDEPLRDYLDRGFDLYGGLGRHPGLHTLFGLPKPNA